MRTTINLEPDIFSAAKKIADAHSVTLGKALSDLARQGLETVRPVARKRGFPVFTVPSGAAPLTLEDVKRDEDGV